MRKLTRSWRCRIGALVLAGIVLYVTAFTFLPPAADSISVTVLQCATVQNKPVDDCPGTTLFQRTITDKATVSEVLAALDRMHHVNIFDELRSKPVFADLISNGGWSQKYVYHIGLLWHGILVESYTAGFLWLWDVTKLGIGGQWATAYYPPTPGPDLVRLTGMPVAPNGMC